MWIEWHFVLEIRAAEKHQRLAKNLLPSHLMPIATPPIASSTVTATGGGRRKGKRKPNYFFFSRYSHDTVLTWF